MLDSCSDGMVFGALQPCDTCGGQLIPRTHHYSCSGNISDWTKCTVTTTDVKRKKWVIPKELKDEFPFLLVAFVDWCTFTTETGQVIIVIIHL